MRGGVRAIGGNGVALSGKGAGGVEGVSWCGWVPVVLMVLAWLGAPALAQTMVQGKGRYTGLPIPRFASLRSDRVNLRVGPGGRYPIKWELHRRGLPVEIVQEYGVWRAVRLHDGADGWIHAALLSGHRTFIVEGATRPLEERAPSTASLVARLEAGVIGRILGCAEGSLWCRVSVHGHRGYLRRSDFWGTFKGEAVHEW